MRCIKICPYPSPIKHTSLLPLVITIVRLGNRKRQSRGTASGGVIYGQRLLVVVGEKADSSYRNGYSASNARQNCAVDTATSGSPSRLIETLVINFLAHGLKSNLPSRFSNDFQKHFPIFHLL